MAETMRQSAGKTESKTYKKEKRKKGNSETITGNMLNITEK